MKYLPLLLLLAAVPASPEDKPSSADGNQLRENCGAVLEGRLGSYEAGYCYGLIDGYVQIASFLHSQSFPRHCVPQGVIYEQLVKVVVKYLDDHPEKLHLPAMLLISQATAHSFPCPNHAK